MIDIYEYVWKSKYISYWYKNVNRRNTRGHLVTVSIPSPAVLTRGDLA